MYLCVYRSIYVSMYLCIYVCVYVCMCICVCVYVCVYVCMCVCICMYMYVHMYVYIYIYTHIHRNYRSHTHIDTKTTAPLLLQFSSTGSMILWKKQTENTQPKVWPCAAKRISIATARRAQAEGAQRHW